MREKLTQTKCPYDRCNSMLHYRGGEVTMLNVKFYYDREWNEHLHDPNIRTDNYKCSNGHCIRHVFRQGCAQADCFFKETSIMT
jgi:hypothetical protein